MIFIIGVGRSGTSLLQSMLNAHPDIVSSPESHFLRKYVFPNMKRNGLVAAKSFFLKLDKDESFKRVSVDAGEIWRDKENAKVNLLTFYNRMFKLYAKSKGKYIFVDKDPRNIDYIPQLDYLFPNSKIVHVYRDPRDIVYSKSKAAWSSNRAYWLHALIGQYQISKGRFNLNKYFSKKERYIEIRYEDLLQAPKDTLKKLTDFIGVDYCNSMLSFSKSSKELVDKSEMQWKKDTFEPLMKTNSNKWRTGLTIFQAGLVEQVSSEYFYNLNYSKEATKDLGSLQRIFLLIFSVFNWVMPVLYRIAMTRK